VVALGVADEEEELTARGQGGGVDGAPRPRGPEAEPWPEGRRPGLLLGGGEGDWGDRGPAVARPRDVTGILLNAGSPSKPAEDRRTATRWAWKGAGGGYLGEEAGDGLEGARPEGGDAAARRGQPGTTR